MKRELIDIGAVCRDKESRFFQYFKGTDLTIVCFNFSLPYGMELQQRFNERGVSCSLFSINSYLLEEFLEIYEDIGKTKQLIIIDDSKSANKSSDRFLMGVYRDCAVKKVQILGREFEEEWYSPNIDALKINSEEIVKDYCRK